MVSRLVKRLGALLEPAWTGLWSEMLWRLSVSQKDYQLGALTEWETLLVYTWAILMAKVLDFQLHA
jgi:hypothetical protein